MYDQTSIHPICSKFVGIIAAKTAGEACASGGSRSRDGVPEG